MCELYAGFNLHCVDSLKRERGVHKMVKFTIIEKIGVLTPGNADNWRKELNYIQWGNNKPKYDIRKWKDNNKQCGKGLTIKDKEELKKCAEFIRDNMNKLNGPFNTARTVGPDTNKALCTLCLEIGKIADSYNDMDLEVNIVQWGNGIPVFDIRPWDAYKTQMGKGISLNKVEAENFLTIYKDTIDSDFKMDGEDIDIVDPDGVLDGITL